MFSNYPNGFATGVTIRGVPLTQSYPGKIFWVGNSAALLQGEVGASDNNSGNFFRPFATLAYAISQCVANRGDIIVVRPGHVTTIVAAAGVNLNVAGVAIIGLGAGSNRPTVNFTTSTAGTFVVSAANCSIMNFFFTGSINALVSPLQIQAADFALLDSEWRDLVGRPVTCLLTTAAANRMLIKNFRYEGDVSAGTGAAIAIVGGDGIVIDGLRMDGNFSIGGIDVRTAATTDLEVRNVTFRTRSSADIFLVDTITGSTGMIGPSLYLRVQDNAANITEVITGATFVVFDDVYVVNAPNEKGLLINWVASADA